MKGTVKFFNEAKGFGFIIPDDGDTGGKDVFIHVSALDGQTITEGDPVSFEIGEGKSGPDATDVIKE